MAVAADGYELLISDPEILGAGGLELGGVVGGTQARVVRAQPDCGGAAAFRHPTQRYFRRVEAECDAKNFGNSAKPGSSRIAEA